MSKKKSQSTVLLFIAGFLIFLGVLMIYNGNVSGNKGSMVSAFSSIIIGGALIVISLKSVRKKK